MPNHLPPISSSKSLVSISVTFSMIFLSRTPRGHSALRRRRSQRTSFFRPQHHVPGRHSQHLPPPPRLQLHPPPIQLRHAYELQWRTGGQRQLSKVHFHARSLQQEWQRLCLLDRAIGREAGCGRRPLWCRHGKGCFESWVGEVYICTFDVGDAPCIISVSSKFIDTRRSVCRDP